MKNKSHHSKYKWPLRRVCDQASVGWFDMGLTNSWMVLVHTLHIHLCMLYIPYVQVVHHVLHPSSCMLSKWCNHVIISKVQKWFNRMSAIFFGIKIIFFYFTDLKKKIFFRKLPAVRIILSCSLFCVLAVW